MFRCPLCGRKYSLDRYKHYTLYHPIICCFCQDNLFNHINSLRERITEAFRFYYTKDNKKPYLKSIFICEKKMHQIRGVLGF